MKNFLKYNILKMGHNNKSNWTNKNVNVPRKRKTVPYLINFIVNTTYMDHIFITIQYACFHLHYTLYTILDVVCFVFFISFHIHLFSVCHTNDKTPSWTYVSMYVLYTIYVHSIQKSKFRSHVNVVYKSIMYIRSCEVNTLICN